MLTVIGTDANSMGATIMDGNKAVALCRPLQIFTSKDGSLISHQVSAEDALKNAHRLAACWNACEGLTQDHFDGGWKAKELSAYAKKKEVELDAARLLLQEIAKILQECDGGGIFDSEKHRIREFLERK